MPQEKHNLNADCGHCCYCGNCSVSNKADVKSSSNSRCGIFDNRTTHPHGNMMLYNVNFTKIFYVYVVRCWIYLSNVINEKNHSRKALNVLSRGLYSQLTGQLNDARDTVINAQ